MKKKNVKLLIVIPVYRRIDLLRKNIEALENSSFKDWELVIVDNATPGEESVELYRELTKKLNVFIVQNRENVGFSKACNIGARRRSGSELIFFLNSDVILDQDALKIMVENFNLDEDLGILGMRLLFPEETDLNAEIRPAGKLQHIGISVDVRGTVHHPLVGWTADHKKAMKIRKAWAVTGAALMIRRSCWNSVGGFDEVYGLGAYEDCDLAMSVRELGYNIEVNPQAWGYHYTGATAEKYQMAYPQKQNYYYFMNKWSGKVDWSDYLYL